MSTLNRFVSVAMIALLAIAVSSCEIVGGIFKTGVWSGVLLVVGGIALVIFLIAKVFGGSRKSS